MAAPWPHGTSLVLVLVVLPSYKSALVPQVESYFGNVNCIGERSCYDEGKRAAETLTFDYMREHGLEVRAHLQRTCPEHVLHCRHLWESPRQSSCIHTKPQHLAACFMKEI